MLLSCIIMRRNSTKALFSISTGWGKLIPGVLLVLRRTLRVNKQGLRMV